MFTKLIPPERYKHSNFDNYNVNSNYPSQLEVKQRLFSFVKNKNQTRWINFFKSKTCEGFYLDGNFGVGKTHLLASVFHAFDSKHKLYTSFTELMALISFHGINKLINELRYIELICIDEFELDDPANTMKASNFIRLAFQQNISVVTTSNTLAGDLGKGSFGYKSFKNEIGFISSQFIQLKICGTDYRNLQKANAYKTEDIFCNSYHSFEITFEQLKIELKSLRFLDYKKYVQPYKIWMITNVEAFDDHAHAIRFTHFIDAIYNSNSELRIFFKKNNKNLFTKKFLLASQQKKYKRCLSRLRILIQ